MMKEKFIKSLSINKKGKSTLRSIEYSINSYSSFINDKPLEDTTENDLLDFVQYLRDEGNGEGTIGLHKAKLRQFFNYAYEATDDRKYRQFKNLLKGKIPGKDISPEDILTQEEVKRLINVATIEQDRAIVSILYESGMRIGELIALNISNVKLNDIEQEVIFNIPDVEGLTKTGSRIVHCLEIFGYVQDWLKCHPNPEPKSQFIQLGGFGIRSRIKNLFERAKITKPANPHNFRHSAITRSVMLGLSDIIISKRYWGISHSNMLDTYIHLSEAMKGESYRRAMGLAGEDTKVVNPLSVHCVECGKLIQSGSLCDTCKNIKKVSLENEMLKAEIQRIHDEKLVEKHEHEQDMESYKLEMDAKMSGMEKTIQNFLKNLQKPILGV